MSNDLGGVWRTVGGRRIFIKDGEDLETAMRNSGKFKKTTQIDANKENKDLGIHYGDLGKARDTSYFAINSSNRSTGHYGTGTYFFSKEYDEKVKSSKNFSRSDRPRKEIDFNDYNLYKVKYDDEAERLHEGLKAINYEEYDSFRTRIMIDDFKRAGISKTTIDEAIDKLKNTKKEYVSKGYDDDYKGGHDSLSSIFMKALGYNGIDVRGIDGYDNTAYGSVIYDLEKKRKK